MCMKANSFSHQKPDMCRTDTSFPASRLSLQWTRGFSSSIVNLADHWGFLPPVVILKQMSWLKYSLIYTIWSQLLSIYDVCLFKLFLEFDLCN